MGRHKKRNVHRPAQITGTKIPGASAEAKQDQPEPKATIVEGANTDDAHCHCCCNKHPSENPVQNTHWIKRWWSWLGSNAIIAIATVVTAGYAGSQYYFGKQTQAAILVPALEVNALQSTSGAPYWTVAPHISNQGNQTSGYVQAVIGIMYRDSALFKSVPNLSDTATNPDTSEITLDADNNITALRKGAYGRPKINAPHPFVSIGGIAPKGDIQLGILAVPETEMKLFKSGAEILFLLGRINYQDSFDEKIWHVSKFCYRVYGNASDTENFSKWGTRQVGTYDPGDLRLSYRLCAFNNCSDSQCGSHQ